MSVSLYYTCRRATPLSDTERARIAIVEKNYAVEDQIEEYAKTNVGFNWESFCIYDPSDPTEHDVIFEGATKLPDNSEDAMWTGLQHWCAALSEIRNVLGDAHWDVRVDDHELQWDEHSCEYDPTQ